MIAAANPGSGAGLTAWPRKGGDEVRGCVTATSVWGAVAIEGPGPVTGGRGPSCVTRGGPEWATWSRARVWRAIASPLSPPLTRLGGWRAPPSP